MEDGQVKLNSVVTSSDCLVGVLSRTRSCLLIQQNTKACREKWKNFLTLLRVCMVMLFFLSYSQIWNSLNKIAERCNYNLKICLKSTQWIFVKWL